MSSDVGPRRSVAHLRQILGNLRTRSRLSTAESHVPKLHPARTGTRCEIPSQALPLTRRDAASAVDDCREMTSDIQTLSTALAALPTIAEGAATRRSCKSS